MPKTEKNLKSSKSLSEQQTENSSLSSASKNSQAKKDVINEIYKQEFSTPPKSKTTTTSSQVFIFYLVMSVIAGFLSGFIQDFWFDGYAENLVKPTETVKQEDVLDLNFLLNEEDKVYLDVLSKLKSQVVGIYKKRTSNEILDSLYLEKDFLGSGVVVTSDGWILTHTSIIDDEDYVVITSDKKVFEPSNEVVDQFSGTVLVQISAQGLSPVRFADLNTVQPTKPLLVSRYSAQNHGSDIVKTAIQKFAYHDQIKGTDFLLSSEKIDHYLKLVTDFDPVYNGAVLVNENVEVVGLLFYSGRPEVRLAIPGYYLNSAVNNFLENSSEIIRSTLGVHYVDLSESLGLDTSVSEGQVKGAVLLGNAVQNILAVNEKSPAQVAELKAGDIILKVNNEDVDERNSLTKLIQDYTPGQEVTLLISRAGEELEIKVVLGEM